MEDREVFTIDTVTKDEWVKKFPLWIIEYIWAHQTLDLQEVMASCDWPDIGSQPLSLEPSWRLRLSSAQMFYIVKNREVQHFNKVVNFLETTHKLLPRLVAPLRHMKLMFGLKTMVVMWMLQQERIVDTVLKINQFFPRELHQYQDQCTQRDQFLMKKNNKDFKTFAQTLALDKERRETYMKNQMEEQYGEHYAQKVEERLLQYLHYLEEALPTDTVIDKILKNRPTSEEEQKLLDVVSSDSTSILTTLKTLLHRDATSCHSVCSPQSPRHGQTGLETLKQPALTLGSSGVPLKSIKDTGLTESPTGPSPEDGLVLRTNQEQSKTPGDGAIWLEVSNGQKKRKHSGSPPQFCYKHKRWVRTILLECSDQQLPAIELSSSSLVQSSSEDLTPSGLVQQGSPTGTGSAPVSHQEIHIRPGSSSLSPPRVTPQLQLEDRVDVASDERSSPELSSGPGSSDHINRTKEFHSSAAPHDDSDLPPAPLKTISRLSRKYSKTVALQTQNPSLIPEELSNFHGPITSSDPSVCPPFTEDMLSHQSPPNFCSTPNPNTAIHQVQTRLSLQTQAVFLQSPLLQPVVNLIRLKPEDCVSGPGPLSLDSSSSSSSFSSFDINLLYSSSSCSSEDSLHRDPDFKLSLKQRKNLFLDYSWFQN